MLSQQLRDEDMIVEGRRQDKIMPLGKIGLALLKHIEQYKDVVAQAENPFNYIEDKKEGSD
jgi:hypothetical protein